ncbi:MAG: hypothetical protein AAGE52_31640 [Myxococcota bacterium]
MTELDQIRTEIEDLHRFFTGWFRGSLELSALKTELEDRLDPAFTYIQPSGALLDRTRLVGTLRTAHASNTHFAIEIRDVKLRAKSGRTRIATYVEVQRGARNTTPAENARLSTVVFEEDPDGSLRWLHVHETAIPVP